MSAHTNSPLVTVGFVLLNVSINRSKEVVAHYKMPNRNAASV